jgi:hypothetical protein
MNYYCPCHSILSEPRVSNIVRIVNDLHQHVQIFWNVSNRFNSQALPRMIGGNQGLAPRDHTHVDLTPHSNSLVRREIGFNRDLDGNRFESCIYTGIDQNTQEIRLSTIQQHGECHTFER